MQQTKKKRRTKKAAVFLLSFVTALSAAAPTQFASAMQTDQAHYVPPGGPDWNKLRDIEIKESGWGYGTTVTDEVYKGMDARKIETNGWWADQLVLNGWQSFDLSSYENGTLEFDVVGKEGGETFDIGFRDVVHERLDGNGGFYKDADANPEETNIDGLANISNYITVTTEWQHASIPLRDIFNSNPLFDEGKIQLLKISGNDTPITFWITNIKVTSPDTEKSYAPIKVNQVGYLNYGEKYANVSGYYNELSADVGTPFQVKRVSDDSVAYSGALSLVAAYDELSGEKVFKADFSELDEIGEYYLTVDGVSEPSVPFEIGPDVYDSLLNDVQKFFYYQRANDDLLPQHAGQFARTGLHKDDSNLPLQSDHSVMKDVSGGWWDAGDTGKYVTAAATAVSDLLWAYERFPQQFSDGQLNIPESGNGIADLLDEIKFETDFFLKMQEDQTGGFYSYVIREPIPNRYIMDGTGPGSIIPTSQTATTVGALAHAYTVMKDVAGLESYANTLLDSAVRGWSYLEAHPEFIAQPDGPYNDNDDLNDRFYAAAALYRATGESKYSDFVVANYRSFESKFQETDFSHGIGSMELIGFYHYLSGPAPSEEVHSWFVPKYKEWISTVIDTAVNEAVWRNSTNKGFYWGANSNVAGVAVSLDIGSRIIGENDERMIQVASGNLNYLLGINPLQLSFITGHGENRVHTTHHEIYMRDFISEMPNGYMPGGPNNNGKYNFPAKAYNQATVDWESNEQALNYNSPLIYLTALLADVENKTFANNIQLDQSSIKLSVGQTKKVTASVTPGNASFKKLQATSADPSIARIGDVTFSEDSGATVIQVTGVKDGRTEVTVQSFDGSIQAKVQVEVVTGGGSGSGSGSGTGSGSGSGSVSTGTGGGTSGTTSGSGTKTEQQNGTLTLTRESLDKAAKGAVNGKMTISAADTASGLKKAVVELPGEWIRSINPAAIQSIAIEVLGSTVELNQELLKALVQNNAGNLSIGLEVVDAKELPAVVRERAGKGSVYEFTLSVDHGRVEQTLSPVKVSLPYELGEGENTNQVIVYKADNGLEIIKNSMYDPESGKVVFESNQLGQVMAAYSNVNFKDIEALPSVESDAIRAAAARGVIVGKEPGGFDPRGKLTRAEFVQMLVNFFEVADPAAESKFTDVKEGAWYYNAVASAEKLGIVQGRTDGTFGKNEVLSRQEMAVLLHRALLASGHSIQPSGQPVSAFMDESEISAYALQPVEALKQANVLAANANGSYAPKASVNRSEAAVLIYNYLRSLYR